MQTLKLIKLLAQSILVCAIISVANGKIIYVDDANGLNDGSSWVDAYKYLQDALADANSAEKPVEIRVAQGVYKPDEGAGITLGDRTAAFQLINGVTLKGGYAGFSQADPNARDIELYKTILSGDLNRDDIIDFTEPEDIEDDLNRGDNSYKVVVGSDTDQTAILEGFTITGGYYGTSGGGMFNYFGNPIVSKCSFAGNWCGGIHNINSNPRLLDCIFERNYIPEVDWVEGGGGVWNEYSNPILENCILKYNRARANGGGMFNYESSPILTNCTFSKNSSDDGGAMTNWGDSSPMVINCEFFDNKADSVGGAIWHSSVNLTLVNCSFERNNSCGGGALWVTWKNKVTAVNCIFSANSAICEYPGTPDNIGGGISSLGGATLTLSNCIFVGNKAGEGNALACFSWPNDPTNNLDIVNCIFWDGGHEIWRNDNSSINISYSDVQDGWPGEGNIDKDPCFAQLGYWDPNGTPQDPNDDFWVDGDYHLKSQAGRWDANEGRWTKDEVMSLCIDAGDPASPIGLEPFPNGGIINMGVYGGTAEASKSYFGKPPCKTIVAGDINGDCIVNFKDFAIMAFHWLEEH